MNQIETYSFDIREVFCFTFRLMRVNFFLFTSAELLLLEHTEYEKKENGEQLK